MKNIDRLHNLLKHADIFSRLNDQSLRLLEEKMTMVSFEPGQVICSEGEPGNCMFLVDSGEVCVIKKGKNDIPIEITSLKSGDVAGVMSLFEDEVRSATLKAKDKVELWELDKQTFQQLLDSNCALSQAMLKILSGHLRRETKIVAELRSYDKDNRLKVAMFDSKPYTEKIFEQENSDRYALKFFEHRLGPDTVELVSGYKVICVFVNDRVNAEVVEKLHKQGVEMIALRCAGFNNVDLKACQKYGISAARVPAYSPYAVAEHAVALMMALNRKTHRAHSRIREGNFSLNGLVGFDMHGKTTGVIGTGKIGKCVIDILTGFGCSILAYDKFPDKNLESSGKVKYVELHELFTESDVITLHAPLTQESYHMINEEAVNKMKHGVMLINTSRGGLVNTQALVRGLKSGKIGHAGLDVYEEESTYFFEDFSESIIQDDVLARLTTFNNVMVTSHMAFLTNEALINIANTTFDNIAEYESGKRGPRLVNNVIPSK